MTIAVGHIVRVRSESSQPGIYSDQAYLDARRPEGTLGEVKTIQNCGGDLSLVWVRHGNGMLAPYWDYELTLVGVPVPPR